MRANKHHKKTQIIGGFKLPYSRSEPLYKREKWVDENDTKKVENITGGLFVNYLRQVENRKVLYFSHNENDENKNPDIFIHIDGKIQSAQITQIVLNDYLQKFNQTKRLCEKISNLIIEIYKPPIKVNIQIYPPWDEEEPPKSNARVHKKVAKIIADSILENIEILSSKNEYLNFNLDKSIFGEFADSYNLYPVPNPHYSNYFGDNNVYIDYEFDDIKISEEDIYNSVNKVYEDKNGGNSDILLIWGDQNQLMNTEHLITKNLQEKFKKTTFKSVYLLFFQNNIEVGRRQVYCSKLNSNMQ